ncbi:MotA/TolQ/ExbB proton channel family protein [Lyngbya aestuarii]|uniref:MotA/TolQ/ExbB proton channel family protein n=1 Tax=Lyngbya aestuarii TaxID=118322 RepID=UPI00403D9FE2
MPRTLSTQSLSKSRRSERQELDIQLPLVLAIALGLVAIIYGVLFPLRTSTLGVLLYDRGFTQYAVMLLACIVVTFTLLKFIKLQAEFPNLRQGCIPRDITLEDPNSPQLGRLYEYLSISSSLVAIRCSRVIAAYMYSGSRKAATELALDDSSFYQAASDSSYSFPRILVWAIPLLGFIGTVIGISGAVTGFSGFLEDAGNIDQIKEGIGNVTTGLAVAFDTTLLALLLSVLVMIPLVFVERVEARLLLSIDVYINDRLLPQFRDTSEKLDETALQRVVDQAIKENLPTPKALIQPAEEYAKQAAARLAEGFLTEVGKVQQTTATLIEQFGAMNQLASQDRQEFRASLEQQQQTSVMAFTNLLSELRATNRQLSEEIQSGNSAVAKGLFGQAEQIAHQLEQAAAALQDRVAALEKHSAQVSEIAQLQQTLEQTLSSLEKSAQLEQLLTRVQENLAQLKPVLEQLSKPRRITLVERE